MRKITEQAARAFLEGRDFNSGNTVVGAFDDRTVLYLHGNPIARFYRAEGYRQGEIHASLAGWPTPTTRERINGLCELVGDRGGSHCARVFQRDHLQYADYKHGDGGILGFAMDGPVQINSREWFRVA